MGYDREDFAGKPVIAVVNTWSEINPCHTHLRDRARGRQARRLAGGRVPAGGPGAVVERAVHEALDDALPQPAGDGDRGAAAVLSVRRRGAAGRVRQDDARADHGRGVGRAAVHVSCRPGRCCGRRGAAARWARAPTSGSTGPSCAPGGSREADWEEIEERIASSPGHCMTMGTASTMTSAVEALGVTMPGAASIPAADSDAPAHGGRRGPPDRRRLPGVAADARVASRTRSRWCWRSAARPTRSST